METKNKFADVPGVLFTKFTQQCISTSDHQSLESIEFCLFSLCSLFMLGRAILGARSCQHIDGCHDFAPMMTRPTISLCTLYKAVRPLIFVSLFNVRRVILGATLCYCVDECHAFAPMMTSHTISLCTLFKVVRPTIFAVYLLSDVSYWVQNYVTALMDVMILHPR